MMRPRCMRLAVLLFSALPAILAGCGRTAPSRFYVLEPRIQSGDVLPGQPGDEVTIGIGPVRLPDYLDRPQIVTRAGGNRLDLAEFDRWAEPLTTDFTRVLADNITKLLSTEDIVFHPWFASVSIDFEVRIEVLMFETNSQGTAVLDARWTLTDSDDGKAIRRSRFEQPVEGEGYEAIVSSQSELLAKLSREIAERIAEAAAR